MSLPTYTSLLYPEKPGQRQAVTTPGPSEGMLGGLSSKLSVDSNHSPLLSLCVQMFCPHVCALHAAVPAKSRRGRRIPENWSSRQL